MNKEMDFVDVTDELAKKIDVYRLQDGGFQRPLRRQRLEEMSRRLGSGLLCPPITVGIVNGKYLLIDGQHRLEAWKLKRFPLKATITKLKSNDEAVASFIALNREAKRIGLSHILTVANDDYSVKIRAISKEAKITVTMANHFMKGLLSTDKPHTKEIADAIWILASKVLGSWISDKRWAREGNAFSTPGTLRLLGYFAGKSTSVDSIIKDLKSLDYSLSGAIGRVHAPSSGAGHMALRAIVYRNLAEKII